MLHGTVVEQVFDTSIYENFWTMKNEDPITRTSYVCMDSEHRIQFRVAAPMHSRKYKWVYETIYILIYRTYSTSTYIIIYASSPEQRALLQNTQ